MYNLQEAYLGVYEATAMAKRGLDEPAIRQQIAKNTGGGQAADRATALENQPTYGDANKQNQRETLARKQRGDFRNTTSSNSGLHGYANKPANAQQQALQAARGAQRGVLTPNEKKQLNREEFDIFDYLLEYLVAEGFADTNEAAIKIMANMSEDWREEILDEAKKYETSVLKDVPSNLHKPVKKALRSQRNKPNELTTRQRTIGYKTSRYRDDEDDTPVRGSGRGPESPTDR